MALYSDIQNAVQGPPPRRPFPWRPTSRLSGDVPARGAKKSIDHDYWNQHSHGKTWEIHPDVPIFPYNGDVPSFPKC